METIWLQRRGGDTPWGFRLQGGRDYQQPLFISKVNPGSIAAQRMRPGDIVCRIGNTDTEFLTHSQAMDLVKACGDSLQVTIAKGGAHYGYHAQPTQVSPNSSGVHDLFQDMYRHSSEISTPASMGGGGTVYSSYPDDDYEPYFSQAPSHYSTTVQVVQASPSRGQVTRQKSREIPVETSYSYSAKPDYDTGYSNRDSGYSTTSFQSNDSNYGYTSPYQTPQQTSPSYSAPSQTVNSDYPYSPQAARGVSDFTQSSPANYDYNDVNYSQQRSTPVSSYGEQYMQPNRNAISDFTQPPGVSDYTGEFDDLSISENRPMYASNPEVSYEASPNYENSYLSMKSPEKEPPAPSWQQQPSYHAEPVYEENTLTVKPVTPTTPKYESSTPFAGYTQQPSTTQQTSTPVWSRQPSTPQQQTSAPVYARQPSTPQQQTSAPVYARQPSTPQQQTSAPVYARQPSTPQQTTSAPLYARQPSTPQQAPTTPVLPYGQPKPDTPVSSYGQPSTPVSSYGQPMPSTPLSTPAQPTATIPVSTHGQPKTIGYAGQSQSEYTVPRPFPGYQPSDDTSSQQRIPQHSSQASESSEVSAEEAEAKPASEASQGSDGSAAPAPPEEPPAPAGPPPPIPPPPPPIGGTKNFLRLAASNSQGGKFPTYLDQQLHAASGSSSPFNYLNQKPDPSQAAYNRPQPIQPPSLGQAMPGQPMPDKIAIMAQKGGPGVKKPFTYAPDVSTLREHREKMRQSNRERRKQEKELTSATLQAVQQMDAPQARPHNQDSSVDDYNDSEANPRYAGNKIPSKAFKYLQKEYGSEEAQGVTSSDGTPDIYQFYYQHPHGAPPDHMQMIYQGTSIPPQNAHVPMGTAGHNFNDTSAAVEKAKESRRRRRQQVAPHHQAIAQQQQVAQPQADGARLGEAASLQGRMAVASEPVKPQPSVIIPATVPVQEKVKASPPTVTTNQTATPWRKDTTQKHKQETPEDASQATPDFDENAYLAGQVSIMGGPTKPIKPQFPHKAPWQKPEAKREIFDAKSYWKSHEEPQHAHPTKFQPSQNLTHTPPAMSPSAAMPSTFTAMPPSTGAMPPSPGAIPPSPGAMPYSPGAMPPSPGTNVPQPAAPLSRQSSVSSAVIELKTTPEPEPEGPPQLEDFDEEAFLAGQISILGREPYRPYVRPVVQKDWTPWEPYEKKDEDECTRPFDEQAYLSGKLTIYGGTSNVPVKPKVITKEQAPWERPDDEHFGKNLDEEVLHRKKEKPKELAPWERPHEEDEGRRDFDEAAYLGWKQHMMQSKQKEEEEAEERQEDFDEAAYLSGKMNILGGPGSSVPHTPKEKKKELAPWERPHEEDEDQREFDEQAIIGRKRITKEPAPWERPHEEDEVREFDEDAYLGRKPSISLEEEDDRDDNKPFNETAFLLGKIPLVSGGDIDPNTIQAVAARERALAEKKKQEEEKREGLYSAVEGDFDEDAYLSGRIGIFGEKKEESYQRPQKERQKKAWEREQEFVKEEEFDESSYLSGRISVGVGASVDTDISSKKVKQRFSKEQESKPIWLRNVDDTKEFDENRFLHKSSQERPPSPDTDEQEGCIFPSTLMKRARSQSREASVISTGSMEEAGEGSTTDEAYNDFMYVGKKIPSKVFTSLDRVTARSLLKAKPQPEMLKKSAEGSPTGAAQPVKTEEQKATETGTSKVTVTMIRSSSSAGDEKPKGLVVLRGKSLEREDSEEKVTAF